MSKYIVRLLRIIATHCWHRSVASRRCGSCFPLQSGLPCLAARSIAVVNASVKKGLLGFLLAFSEQLGLQCLANILQQQDQPQQLRLDWQCQSRSDGAGAGGDGHDGHDGVSCSTSNDFQLFSTLENWI